MERDQLTPQGHQPPVYFNSHAHVERDSCNVIMNKISKNFNSHAHVERDVGTRAFKNKVFDFNSHAHVERDARMLC